MTRKVAVVGSTSFPINAVICAQIVDVIRGFEGEVLFLTRGRTTGLDAFIAIASIGLGHRCFGYPGKGGGDNLARDQELVDDCDEMLAFFDPASLEYQRQTGTAMIVQRALASNKPVRVATVAAQAVLVWADS